VLQVVGHGGVPARLFGKYRFTWTVVFDPTGRRRWRHENTSADRQDYSQSEGLQRVHVLTTIFGVVNYAARCGMKVNKVGFADLELGTRTDPVVPFFTREQATQIVVAAKEPFKTLFELAWNAGLRAGEILALTVADLDFTQHTIRVNKSADDLTQIVRQPKTKCSVATLPMTSSLESVLQNYLKSNWQPNPSGILFPAKCGTRSRSRRNVVTIGLHPILRKLGIPTLNAGLPPLGMASQQSWSSKAFRYLC
jgi:integrase